MGGQPRFHTLVLGGGRSTRMGYPKALLHVDDVPLLRSAIEGSFQAGSKSVGVVAPRTFYDEVVRGRGQVGVWQCLEDPPFGGPLAGIEAGAEEIRRLTHAGAVPRADYVAVVACDVPGLPAAIWELAKALPAGSSAAGFHGVVGVDEDGWRQPLLAIYRQDYLESGLAGINAECGSVRNVAARRLLDGGSFKAVELPALMVRDVDTASDLHEYLELKQKGETLG